MPTLTVRADVAPGVLPETVVDDLAPAIAELNAGLPSGYQVAVGGIAEESAESQASVFAVVPLMLLIMLTVLMFHLQSFQRLFMVLAILPLGLIGVVAALLVSGRPLGFVAILGILALIGMIAKNAVILITQIEADREEGRDVWDAVVTATSSRLRPMSLTAISTVLGLIPIAPTVFWGPMAFAIMGGLLVATMLTLVFLPTVYVTWFRGKEGAAEARSADPARPRRLEGGPPLTTLEASAKAARVARAAIVRGAGFLVLWLVLIGAGTSDLAVGLVTAAAAAWASLRLLPPGPGRVRPAALAELVPAVSRAVRHRRGRRRAARPRSGLPLRPGFVRCPIRPAQGPARSAFCAFSSLLPGTLPAGPDHDGTLLMHCLDVGQPVPAQTGGGGGALRSGCWAERRRWLSSCSPPPPSCWLTVALGLVRILRGPSAADRMMAAQLLGTGGIAVLLLLAAATGVSAAIDVALTLALLAAFASVAFVTGLRPPRRPARRTTA